MVDIHKLIMLIILIINTKQNRYRQYFEIILHIQLKNEMNYKNKIIINTCRHFTDLTATKSFMSFN